MDVITIETPSLGDRGYLVHDGRDALVVDPQRDIDRILAVAEGAGVSITHIAETHVVTEPGSDTPPAAFTGGSLLLGTVGRTDLIAPAATDEFSRAQYRSANRLAGRLPDEAKIHPTHGFGSFCASAHNDGESDGTMATERAVNVALTAADEDAFVEQLLAGLDDHPRYYAHMGPLNRAGAVAVDLSPPAPVDPIELARRIHRGEWAIDLRPRKQFAATHLAGTIGIELADGLATYLAWLVPWGMPVTLLGDSAEDVAEAQRQLVRVGIDRPAGAAVGSPGTWAPDAQRSNYPVIGFGGLVDQHPELPLLDVRLVGQHRERHVAGAINVPLHELLDRLDDVPPGTVAVHCQSGYRASIAASLLDRSGHDVILIDDDAANAAHSGRPVVGAD